MDVGARIALRNAATLCKETRQTHAKKARQVYHFAAYGMLFRCGVARSVWFKHREARFYSAFAQGLGMAVASVPPACLDAMVYTIVTYFM